MKRVAFTSNWLGILLVVLLALSACERPVPRDDTPESPDVVQPTLAPLLIPTPLATEEPLPEAYPAPDTGESGDADAETAPSDESVVAEPETSSGDSPEPAETQPTETSYTVQAGDTLGQIAERFDVTLEDLAAANGITNIDVLDVGQVLTIPVGGLDDTGTTAPEPAEGEEQTHVVRAGENLFRIGLVYGFTADELASYNGITNPERIEIGQVIRIPPSN